MTDSNLKLLETIEEKLAREDPQLCEEFVQFVKQSDSPDLEIFFEEVDDSDYSLKDWAEAFVAFKDWLLQDSNDPVMNFVNMLGYLHCCQFMISENLDRPNLQSIVNQCLTDYGYDQLSPSQT